MNTITTRRIPELDGLRAFSVLLVIICHMAVYSGTIPLVSAWNEPIIAGLGRSGVTIFFTISGFIITLMLLREHDIAGRVSLSSFYARRFFRIIPPFAVYLTVIFGLGQAGYLSTKPINFLWSALFLTNWDVWGVAGSADGSMWFLAHTWSLSVEEQYYLILPPIMILVLGFRLRRINLLVISLFCLCLFSYKLAYLAAAHIHPGLIKLIWLYQFRYILVGVLMALHKNRVYRLLADTSVMVPILLLGYIWVATSFGQLHGVIFLLLNTLEAFSFGFLMLWVVANPAKCGMLRWRWVQWMGTCSYSIYLWQQLFTGNATFYNGWTIAQSPLAILPIIACASLSYYAIERPAIRLGRVVSTRVSVRKSPSLVEAADSPY